MNALHLASYLVLSSPFLAAQACAAEGPTFGFVPYAVGSQPDQYASNISSDGRVVVGRTSYTFNEGFYWSPGDESATIVPRTGPWHELWALDASDRGEVIVGWAQIFNVGIRAFRYSSTTGSQELGFPAGHNNSEAHAVSADGSTIVGYSFGGSREGFTAWTWRASRGFVEIPTPPGHNGLNALAVSSDGTWVAGSAYTASSTLPFIWSQSTGIRLLHDVPDGAANTVTSAISDQGSIIAGTASTSRGYEGFRWSIESGYQMLGFLNPEYLVTGVGGMSADGTVIVGESDGRAFIWDSTTGLQDLRDVAVHRFHAPLDGITLRQATGVSADGAVIAGNAYDSRGVARAFMLRIPGACLADWNADGGIDGTDVESFFHSWEAGDADADYSGGTDGTDVAAFFIAWGEGC